MKAFLIIASALLAGCAVKTPVATPLPAAGVLHFAPATSLPDPSTMACFDWVSYAKSSLFWTDEDRKLIAEHLPTCKALEDARDAARRDERIKYYLSLHCASKGSDSCEMAIKEEAAAWRLAEQLDDRFRGIIHYVCPEKWALRDQTCWQYLPSEVGSGAADLWLHALKTARPEIKCSSALTGGMDLCQMPAEKEN